MTSDQCPKCGKSVLTPTFDKEALRDFSVLSVWLGCPCGNSFEALSVPATMLACRWKELRVLKPVAEEIPPHVRALIRLIRFEAESTLGGGLVAEFHRREKIDDLLDDPGSLGKFLRDLVMSGPKGSFVATKQEEEEDG